MLRDVANLLPTFDPFWRSMLRHSARIAVKTEDTRRCLPRKSRERAVVHPGKHGLKQPFLAGNTDRVPPLKAPLRGTPASVKGVHLAVKAIALSRDQVPVTLTIVGKGPEEIKLKDQVRRLGLEGSIHFSPLDVQVGSPCLVCDS